MRSQRGQASLEYVAVLAVVVVLFGAATAVAVDTTQVARRITREVARSFCLVRGGDCRRDLEPCVVSADGRGAASQIKLVVFTLGRDESYVTEERSDGTVAITRVAGWTPGVEVSVGAGLDVGDLLAAQIDAGGQTSRRFGEASTWILSSAAAARGFLDRVRAGTAPAPHVTYRDETGEGRLQVSGGLSGVAQLLQGEASAGVLQTRGTRVDRRTGRRTVSLVTRDEAQVSGHVIGNLLEGSQTLVSAGGERLEVELDAAGRPVSLAVVEAGAYRGSGDLPAIVSEVQGRLAVPAGGERRFEVTTRLDLTEPRNLAAAAAFLGEVQHPDDAPGRIAAVSAVLRARMQQEGTVEARVLASHEQERRFAAEVSVLGGAGGEYTTRSWTAELAVAASRGLDGQWLVRSDCAAGA